MLLTLDYETYFAKGYSLKEDKLTTIEYVRDPQFKAHGVAVKEDDEPAKWITHADIPEYLACIKPEETTLLCHNTYFDGLVNTQQYGCGGFKRYSDTMGIAQFVVPDHDYPKSLESLAKLFKLKGKLKDILDKTKGIRDLPPELEKELATYAIQDVELTYQLYQLMHRHMPEAEHQLLHMTIRMGVEPRLCLDEALLIKCEADAVNERDDLIAASGYPVSELSSNPKFCAILDSLGVEVPTKISAKTNKIAPALGKNDIGFKNLIADYPEHNALWEARMAAKSTIHISRPARFLKIKRSGNGRMPMPLKYAAAHTLRWGGTDKLNVQNLPQLNKSDLRKAIVAPDGYVVLVIDSSQIERRFNAYLAGQISILDLFRRGEDLYGHAATEHFGYHVEKKTHPNERQFGKLLELALGFGMGHLKFRVNSALGFMGCPAIHMTETEAYQTVHGWRARNNEIPTLWNRLQDYLSLMTSPTCDEEYMGIRFTHECVEFPGGRFLHYPNLHCTEDGWVYGNQYSHKIYGGLFDENIVQSGARHIVADQLIDLEDALPYLIVVGMTHDEGICLVHESKADEALEVGIEIFSTAPAWCKDIPLAAEGGYAKEYSK